MQWLKEIPSHWGVCLLGGLAKLKTGGTPSFYLKEVEEDYVDWFTPSDFADSFDLKGASRKLNKKDFEEAGIAYFPANSILIIGIGGTAGKVSYNSFPCYSNQQITAIIPYREVNSAYCTMYIRSLRDFLLKTAPYTTLPILNNTYLSSIKIVLPPLSEQKQIVRYLEDKTSKIDAYVSEKEKEILLLQELKQKTIADAVTKGLNPDAKMKDSGVSWIGMIPEHWETPKIGSLFVERREKVSDKDYPALSVSKQGVTPQLETAVKTDNGDNRKKVCVGDFVVNSRSDRKGSCGVSSYTGSVSLINIVLKPFADIEGMYFHYLFRSNNYIEEYYRIGRGIVADLWTTRYCEMRNIIVPLPPLDEQRAIVSYIEEKCQKIDSLTTELQAEIDHLKEYKQRLIADVVTGQVNVQNH